MNNTSTISLPEQNKAATKGIPPILIIGACVLYFRLCNLAQFGADTVFKNGLPVK